MDLPGGAPEDSLEPDTLRVALYAGVAFERDAVSRSFMEKLRLFDRLSASGVPVEATGFTQASDFDDESIKVVPNLLALIRQPEFRDADVHIFEFAMWYELFNALFLIDRPSMVIDHNTTPSDLVTVPEVKMACERARIERHNLSLADHLMTVSEFTRDQLLEMGIDRHRLSVLHLPPANSFVGRQEHDFEVRARDGLVRLAYVGRLVRAKGVLDLLAAAEALWKAGDARFTLTIAGSLRFSDDQTVEAVQQAISAYGGDGRFSFLADAGDEEIAALYGRSDALVMPSYHEGYCVPVVEAMTSGCYVIGSDAGNLPTIMGGLGTVFRTGEVRELGDAIDRFVGAVGGPVGCGSELLLPTSAGSMRLSDWHEGVARHLKSYTHEHYERQFLRTLARVLDDSPHCPSHRAAGLRDLVCPTSTSAS